MLRDSREGSVGSGTPSLDLLERIFSHKRAEVAARKKIVSLREVQQAAETAAAPLDFVAALRRASFRPALIAEIKRASPSRGLLAPALDPLGLARTYIAGGASAISVLTDEHFFAGSLDDLRAVAASRLGVPLLRKDFVCDPYQVYEARAAGADAVLLIAAHLEPALLCELHRLTHRLSMAALVEVHDEADLERALACRRPHLIGINNRDLRTFEVSLDVTRRLAPRIPASIAVVAESGIFTPQHVNDLATLTRGDGAPAVDAILVGEALVTAPDIAALAHALATAGVPRFTHSRSPIPDPRYPTRERRAMIVKICGITAVEDGLAALDAGADMLGFNFHPPSPRYVTPLACARIISALRRTGPPFAAVGIFVNAPPSEVARLLAECDLDLAQLSGDETPEDLAALRGRAFKAIRVTGPAAADGDARRFAIPGEGRTMPAMLLDAAAGAGQYGGTGQMADWQVAAALAARYHLLLAGGLNPENVAEAVRAVRPWGVDVASGVESSPGRKDPTRIRAFIESAHRAATHLPECGTRTSADQRG